MSKTNFSSSVSASLQGRSKTADEKEATFEAKKPEPSKKASPKKNTTKAVSVTDKKGKTDKGLGTNQDGSFRQSNGGRKVIDADKHRRNFSLCLGSDTIRRIEEHISSSGKTRKATHYVSQYIEDHLEEILDKI